MKNKLKNLDYLFNPRSIAFVGATEAMAKWGFIIFNNILMGGYAGKLYPVNPGRKSILGIKTWPSVRDIPDEIDLAVFTVPAPQVVESIDDCVARGVKAGVVISAGFKELGGEHVGLEASLVAKAQAGGMALVGPNGQGICCPGSKLYAWMPNYYPPDGSVGVIAQSGNIQNMLISGVVEPGFGVSKAVSSGNEADLKIEDFFEYYANDPSIDVISSYIEGIPDGRRFIECARAATKKKPIIVIKGGRTASGISAAKSHTGAMAVGNNLFESVCKQSGVTLAHSIEDASTFAASFLNRPLPRGRRVGILTGGGGLGVIASDVCAEEGLEVVNLKPETLEKIGKMMPNWWVPGNPVDMVAGLNFGSIIPIMEILMKSGEIDSLIVLFIGPKRHQNARPTGGAGTRGVDISKVWDSMTKQFGNFTDNLYDLMHEMNVPLYVVSNFNAQVESVLTGKKEKTIMVHDTIESACRSVAAMAKYYEYKEAGNRP